MSVSRKQTFDENEPFSYRAPQNTAAFRVDLLDLARLEHNSPE
jgi:hypothetical protein